MEDKIKKFDELKNSFGDQIATRLANIENDSEFWKGRYETAFKGHTRKTAFLLKRIGSSINRIMHFYDSPQKCFKTCNLINIGPLWAWQNLCGYGRMILTKF